MTLSDIDVLILCGGQGSRIRHLLPVGYPKCMADVNGTPFVDILIEKLTSAGFDRLVFLAAYGGDVLDGYLRDKYAGPGNQWLTVMQREQLGTGGAVLNAEFAVESDPFFVANGDTWTDFDLASMADCHVQTNGLATVAVDGNMRNCGVFVFSKRIFEAMREMDRPFSTEDLFAELGRRHETVNFYYVEKPEFHDIGTPEGLTEFREFWSGRITGAASSKGA